MKIDIKIKKFNNNIYNVNWKQLSLPHKKLGFAVEIGDSTFEHDFNDPGNAFEVPFDKRAFRVPPQEQEGVKGPAKAEIHAVPSERRKPAHNKFRYNKDTVLTEWHDIIKSQELTNGIDTLKNMNLMNEKRIYQKVLTLKRNWKASTRLVLSTTTTTRNSPIPATAATPSAVSIRDELYITINN